MAKLSLLLLTLLTTTTRATPPQTTLIDSTGSLSRSPIPPTLTTSSGIVTIITSPGTSSPLTPSSPNSVVLIGVDEDSVSSSTSSTITITSPGATLSGTSSLARGNGAAAASCRAGCVVLNGITESDLEKSAFESTRHGHTLSAIFRARLMDGGEEEEMGGGGVCTLVLVVPTEGTDIDMVIGDVEDIFETAKVGLGLDVNFDDLYVVRVEVVQSEAEAAQVMKTASTAATAYQTSTPNPPPLTSIPTLITSTYTKMSSTSEPSPSVASAILSCDSSLTSNHRTARAKLTAWRSRTTRGLTVDHFGKQAAALLRRATESYDRDTILAAGLPGSIAGPYRLEGRSKLTGRIEGVLRELFEVQVRLLLDGTVKKFEAQLLRKHGSGKGGGGTDDGTVDTEYDDNAAMVRSALLSFETVLEDLVVPSLSLTKEKALREMQVMLETALLSFPDSAAARLKDLKQVTKAANRQSKPKEKAGASDRSVDIALDLVAMIRPDGFGSLQGFVGYQLGQNSMTVGVHNDADSPDVIAQFGGKRPPFMRFQPKLKVDVEL